MSIRKSVVLVPALLLLLCLSDCHGTHRSETPDTQNGMTTDSLISRGSKMIRSGLADSAIMFYTIVTERYENGYDNTEATSTSQAVNAYTNLGYIFSNHTIDYHRAYDYTQRALEICRNSEQTDTALSKMLPYIYLNLGVITGSYADSRFYVDSLGMECEQNIEKAFYSACEKKEWRPFLISYYNLTDILLQKEDTAGLRKMTETFRNTEIPAAAMPLLDYCRNLEKIVTLWLNGDFAAVIRLTELTDEIPADDGPAADNFRYMSRYIGARAVESTGDTATADALMNSLANDIDSSMSDNAKLWIFKIMAHRFEKRDPEKSRLWQLKYYITHEGIDSKASLTGTDNISIISEMRNIKCAMKADRESARRARSVLLLVVVAAVFIIAGLLLFILWQRRANHYRRTIVNKQLAMIGAEKERIPLPVEERQETTTTTADSGILTELQERIKNVFDDIPTVCRSDFSLTTLCETVGSNTTYVSKAIRLAYGKPFSAIVNEIRVAEACRRFAAPDSEKYTVEAVGQELGFKSRSNFTAVFKKITGLSPSEFKKFTR